MEWYIASVLGTLVALLALNGLMIRGLPLAKEIFAGLSRPYIMHLSATEYVDPAGNYVKSNSIVNLAVPLPIDRPLSSYERRIEAIVCEVYLMAILSWAFIIVPTKQVYFPSGDEEASPEVNKIYTLPNEY